MSNTEKYQQLIDAILDELASDTEYEETLDVILDCTVEIEEGARFLCIDPYDLAKRLHDTDGALPMHPLVAEFCLNAYFDEYAAGSAEAACNLGSLYYTGRAGEQDYAKAVEYYTFADEHGNEQAAENLGYCYYYGRSVDVDYEKAFRYYLKGALTGHVCSLYKIGDFYRNGYYVPKDESEAFRIYSHCADCLDDESGPTYGADVFMRLAACHYKGIGTEQDLGLALRLYQMAESMYYDRLRNGDFMICANLDRVVKEEEEVRQLLRTSMPDKTRQ